MIIVVPGAGINKNGDISKESERRALRAKQIYDQTGQPLLLCGKYSFLYQGTPPKKTEAEKMRDFLIEKGAEKKHIFLEKKSQDTLGNAYYAKTEYFIPNKETEAVIVTSDFHLQRAKYIFKKVFGKEYNLSFVVVFSKNTDKKIISRQKQLLDKTKIMLKDVGDGDHRAVKEKLYKDDYYKEKRPEWVKKFASQGE